MKYTHDFETFWKMRCRRDGEDPKFPASKSWKKMRRLGHTAKEMIHGTRCAARKHEGIEDRSYICMTVTWLNQRRFLDYEDTILKEYRPLTPAETRAWEKWSGTALPPERAVVGEENWPPGWGKRG